MAKKTVIDHKVGDKIKSLRAARDWSQQDLADKAGIHKMMVFFIESKRRDPSITILIKIAHALGIEVAQLFEAPCVCVFDMKRLKYKYKHHSELPPDTHKALLKVYQWAKEIKVNGNGGK